jgi:hypothetical protein
MTWNTVASPIYTSTPAAINTLDAAGGGANIAVGTVFVDSNINNLTGNSTIANFKLWRRNSSGATSVTFAATAALQAAASTFSIRETRANTAGWSPTIVVTIAGSGSVPVAANIPAALSAAGLVNVDGVCGIIAGSSTGLQDHRIKGRMNATQTNFDNTFIRICFWYLLFQIWIILDNLKLIF